MERFQYDIAAFRNGTSGLSANAKIVYLAVLEEMYLAEGPIPNNLRRIAGLADISWQAARSALEQLIVAGKLTEADGMLNNDRAAFEIAKMHEWRAKRGDGGSRGGRPKKAASQPDLTGISGSSQPHLGVIPPHDKVDVGEMRGENMSKINGSENLDGFPKVRLVKVGNSLGAKAPNAADAANSFAQPPPKTNGRHPTGILPGFEPPPKIAKAEKMRARCYELGKEIFPPEKSGALVSSLHKAKGDWDEVHAVLVATKKAEGDREDYCRKIIHKSKNSPSGQYGEDWF